MEDAPKFLKDLEAFGTHCHHLSVEGVIKSWPPQKTVNLKETQPELEPKTYYDGARQDPKPTIRQLSIINGTGNLKGYSCHTTGRDPEGVIGELHTPQRDSESASTLSKGSSQVHLPFWRVAIQSCLRLCLRLLSLFHLEPPHGRGLPACRKLRSRYH